jgi:hypothetical protein
MTIKLDAQIYDEPLPTSWLVGRIDHDYITIDKKRQEDGSWKFAVYQGDRRVLSKEGEWAYESMPSNRPDDWYETHRFATFEEAAALAKPAAEAILKEMQERVALMNTKAAERDAGS